MLNCQFDFQMVFRPVHSPILSLQRQLRPRWKPNLSMLAHNHPRQPEQCPHFVQERTAEEKVRGLQVHLANGAQAPERRRFFPAAGDRQGADVACQPCRFPAHSRITDQKPLA